MHVAKAKRLSERSHCILSRSFRLKTALAITSYSCHSSLDTSVHIQTLARKRAQHCGLTTTWLKPRWLLAGEDYIVRQDVGYRTSEGSCVEVSLAILSIISEILQNRRRGSDGGALFDCSLVITGTNQRISIMKEKLLREREDTYLEELVGGECGG